MVFIGDPNQKCVYNCSALLWKDETKGFCCLNGKVRSDSLPVPPQPLLNLLERKDPQHIEFRKRIRPINHALAMTSIGFNGIEEGSFMPTFKISGYLYHQLGSLTPSVEGSSTPKFLQILRSE